MKLLTDKTKKIAKAGGQSALGGLLVFMFTHFAEKSELAETKLELEKTQEQLRDARERLSVVDYIVMNEQQRKAEKYE